MRVCLLVGIVEQLRADAANLSANKDGGGGGGRLAMSVRALRGGKRVYRAKMLKRETGSNLGGECVRERAR